jgi:hypothetical protein
MMGRMKGRGSEIVSFFSFPRSEVESPFRSLQNTYVSLTHLTQLESFQIAQNSDNDDMENSNVSANTHKLSSTN